MKVRHSLVQAARLLVVGIIVAVPASGADRATVLYDAFGDAVGLKKDWGFAALVEVSGKRILFDTGNDAGTFAANVRALKIDLKTLDFVVISHRHSDHTSGLGFLLRANPTVKIYVPAEAFGSFGSILPAGFYPSVTSLPRKMRYFDGADPAPFASGSPWPGANFMPIDATTEVAPGLFVVPTISRNPGTLEMRELTLAWKSPHGLVLVVGCAHAGIEEILKASSSIDSHATLVMGGLHLVKASNEEIDRLAHALHDSWKLDRIAPGHCTGEPAFARLAEVFGEAYQYAGVGSIVALQ